MDTLSGEKGFEEFGLIVGLDATAIAERRKALAASFMPFKVTRYYADLIARSAEPTRSQLLNIILPPVPTGPFKGRFDPYGNTAYRQDAAPYIQHKYQPTLLLHIDDFCISNCQFCYKVREIRHEARKEPPLRTKVENALAYITDHPGINNVLFTGGDPAAFRRTTDLIALIGPLIDHPSIRLVRFATKGLAYDPDRFLDGDLLAFFSECSSRPQKQISVIAQYNHPAEITANAQEALRALQAIGVQIRGQPAVVRGVNDEVETLVELQRTFLDTGIISYYFTIFMPVRGVEGYALELHDAYSRFAASKRRLSGPEKKGVLLASHDFGKFEICGFLPSEQEPRQIVLKWHEAAMAHHLPDSLKQSICTEPESIVLLDYRAGIYCIDDLLRHNGLPYFDSDNRLIV